MKMILLTDVKNLGKRNDVVEVSSGYATNYLLPRKLAVAYTSKSKEILEDEKAKHAEKMKQNKDAALVIQKALESIKIEFKAKSAPDGRMVGTISYKQVEDELKNKHHLIIDKRKIIDKYQINTFGLTKLKVELFKGVVGIINVYVSEKK